MNSEGPQRSFIRIWITATVAVAATYLYFLIFAEFALLELARSLDPGGLRLRSLMGVLGAGGILGSLLAAWQFRQERYVDSLSVAFLACGAAGALALWARDWSSLVAIAGVVGLSLGGLTVTLAAGLRAVLGGRRLGLCLGAGTGIAYAVCNLPVVFGGGAVFQTQLAVMGVSIAAMVIFGFRERPGFAADEPRSAWRPWLPVLLALVALDSAAFYIIQHDSTLRAATWAGTSTLWGNAAIHFGAALFAGGMLDRGVRAPLAVVAYVLLALACLGLDLGVDKGWPVEWLYAAGVSLYSVVLVHVPARSGRPWVAGAVFSIAGWAGSAFGIGAAQALHRVPSGFVIAAGLVMATSLLIRGGRRGLVAKVVAVAAAGTTSLEGSDPMVLRGRDVYRSEGCIHCHSQFVRPTPEDVTRWGPATDLESSLRETPPLYGNRRQGPDLAQVGNRRSEAWNRLHLIAPRAVSPGSRMPSYAHLFASGDTRGEALVSYLASLGADTGEVRQAANAAWQPALGTVPVGDGARRYAALCASCHGLDGRGEGLLTQQLGTGPIDLRRESWRYVRGEDEVLALMRIVKFGVPGTAMAGHEYLSDAEVVAIARHVQALRDRGDSASAR